MAAQLRKGLKYEDSRSIFSRRELRSCERVSDSISDTLDGDFPHKDLQSTTDG